MTVSGAIGGTGALSLTAAGALILSGTNRYGGVTNVNAGMLVADAVDAISGSSALTISGGTLDVSGFANTVASLNITNSGTLNLGLGNTLASNGTAALNGTLNVSGTGSLGNYRLLSYTTRNRFLRQHRGPRRELSLLYKTTELDAEHKAQIGTITLTAVYPTVITGGTTALTVNIGNLRLAVGTR